ncbi:MAG: 3-hydroxybutyrate dehydrogenase [Proteobacteria bacterium]|nr:3-hydroxybutyrate dehydrogenase [Pseudomonadota bacterium]
MTFNLSGKTAIITGSTSGIGLAIAQKLANMNANVVISGLEDENDIQKNLEELKTLTNGHVLYVQSDLSKPEGCFNLIDKAILEFNKVDILVNNAGIQFVSPIEDFPIEKWNMILNTNLSSVFYCTQKVLPIMRQNNFGRIINIASVHGVVASPQKSAYVAAKHGVIGLTKVIALETAKDNITCNAICPGWVLTPLVKKQIEDRALLKGTSFEIESLALLSEKQPSQQYIEPEDIGDLVLFLSSKAAAQITGVDLKIDGGWTAQ